MAHINYRANNFFLRKNIFSSKSLLLILCSLLLWACTKIEDKPPQEQRPPQPDLFFITEITGEDTYVGMIVNDPIDRKQYAAFGPRDKEEQMDSIRFIMENFPESDGWMSHEFDENFIPKETTTSTGHTLEYTEVDIPAKKATVTVKETESGRVVLDRKAINLPDNIYDLVEEAKQHHKTGKNKHRIGKADLLYLGGNMAGCFIGAAGIGMGGPIAAAWGAYNTYQSCKSAAGAIGDMMGGNPAFGCMSAADHMNTLSSFGEAYKFGGNLGGMAKGGLPTLIGYAAQAAGQEECDQEDDDGPPPLPELPPRDAGVSWGDPHMNTLDGFLYDFHGVGEFISARSSINDFEVQVRLGNPYINNPQTTFNTGIAVNTGKDVVCFIAEPQKLYINNVEHPINFSTISLKNNASVKKQANQNHQTISIQHQSGDLVEIRFTSLPYFDYSIRLTDNRKGKMEGLMGNYDGIAANDLKLKNGTAIEKKFNDLYPSFADSWRIEPSKSLFYYESGKNTETYTRKDLPKNAFTMNLQLYEWAEKTCRDAGVNEEPFLSGCIVDVASSNRAEVAQSSLYAMMATQNPIFDPLDIDNILLQSDAVYSDNSIRLTRNTSYLAGRAFHKNHVKQNFETEFVFRAGISQNGGADGFALVLAKEIPESKGNPYPGKEGRLGYHGIPASLAIEFDNNLDYFEESPNHVAIHSNGTGLNNTLFATRLAFNKSIPTLEDGMFHKARVRYQNKKISVWLDEQLVLETEIDLATHLGLNNQQCYLGLTASTSISSQAHFIHSWKIQPL